MCIAGALSGVAALMLAAGLSPARDVAQASDVVNEPSLALGYVSPRSVYWIEPEANSPWEESIYRQWIGIDLASNRTCDQRSTIGES